MQKNKVSEVGSTVRTYCTSETEIILIYLDHELSINIPEYTTIHPIIDKSKKKNNMMTQRIKTFFIYLFYFKQYAYEYFFYILSLSLSHPG